MPQALLPLARRHLIIVWALSAFGTIGALLGGIMAFVVVCSTFIEHCECRALGLGFVLARASDVVGRICGVRSHAE